MVSIINIFRFYSTKYLNWVINVLSVSSIQKEFVCDDTTLAVTIDSYSIILCVVRCTAVESEHVIKNQWRICIFPFGSTKHDATLLHSFVQLPPPL